jgi:glycosyltransferase involved in cell wall biosynthesis
MSLLEAMSYGRCCLTSDIPECAEVLEDTGVTFARGSVEALRSALGELLADEERRHALGAQAQSRVAEHFGWDAVVERTLELYGGHRDM